MEKYIKYDKLLWTSSYILLVIPILIWLTFWFKWYIAAICDILLIIAVMLAIKKFKPKEQQEYNKIFNKKRLIVIFIIIVAVNLISGAGGFGHQNWDYNFRNLVFNDLITHKWPVIYDYSNNLYETNFIGNPTGMLSYYIAYWLPSALVGKIFGFTIGSFCLLITQILMTCSFFYLLFRKMNNTKIQYLIVFLCFGGLDVISGLITGANMSPIGISHIDTITPSFCLSTFITQLFWVFNQSLPAWIIVMLILNEKRYEHLGLMVALLLPFGPFPCLGIIIYAIQVIIFGFNFDKLIDFKRIKELFSIQNILSVISVIPIGLIFTLNQNKKGLIFLRAFQQNQLKNVILAYILFIIVEFGFYIIIVNKDNWKKILTYFLTLGILSTIYFGIGSDFGNRTTIPFLILLFYEVIKFIDNNKKDKIKLKMLYVFLAISAFTNISEINRGIAYTAKHLYHGELIKFTNPYKTLDTFGNEEYERFVNNFVSPINKNYIKMIIK